MNSQATNHASSSSKGGSGQIATVSQEFLSVKEHLENFELNYYECFRERISHKSLEWKGITSAVVENLRKDLGAASDGSQIPETLDKYYPRTTGWSSVLKHATPLHWAVLIDDQAMVQATLQSGKVDVNAEMGDLPKYTALHLAMCVANVDIVKILLGHGATVNIGDGFFRHGGLQSLVKNGVIFQMISKEVLESAVCFHDARGQTALHHAAMEGAQLVVEYLVERNANINLCDDDGRTALHYAARVGAKPVVEYLVEQNADINLRDNEGKMALHYAAMEGAKLVVEYLVERTVNINLCDDDGRSALHHAARVGAKPVVEYLVERNADINLCDCEGRTALHYAAWVGAKPVVEYLVKWNVDINLCDCEGKTALHHAAIKAEMPIVEYLVEWNANINLCDREGKTALHHAARVGAKPVVEYLVERNADINLCDREGKTALHHAAGVGAMLVVEYLVERNADINLCDREGKTAFHHAARVGAKLVVDYLVKWNIDINLRDHEGKTALHHAAIEGVMPVVEYLVERNADINLRDHEGKTALHNAAQVGAMPVVDYLVKRNVDINLRDLEGKTALHHAAIEGARPIVEYLVKSNADINLRDNEGKTAFHHAARVGAKLVVDYLVKWNIDINLCDHEGKTALHHVAIEGVMPIVEYLVKHNANINLRDDTGKTALHHAIMKKKKHVAEYLVEHNANVYIKDSHGANSILYSIWFNFMDTLTSELVGVEIVHIQDEDGNNALHYAVRAYDSGVGNIGIVKRLRELDVDMNARNNAGYTPFFAAVLGGHTEVVKELLLSKERIKIMEECDGKTPIQIAYDNDFQHIKRALLECDDVSRYMDTLYRDRQVYVDAANAILVGAALIASVTFASWLQPPLGYTPYSGELYANSIPAPSSSHLNYVDVQHNKLLRGFWVFNCLSFYFAIATVVFGARSVLPQGRLFIKKTVEKLRSNLLVTSFLLACSVSFVIMAFGIAGCIVLTPMLKFQWYMIGPTIIGGIVCLGSLAFLLNSMFEDACKKKSGRQRVYWLTKGIDDLDHVLEL